MFTIYFFDTPIDHKKKTNGKTSKINRKYSCIKKEINVQLHSFAYKTVAGTIKNYRVALKNLPFSSVSIPMAHNGSDSTSFYTVKSC